MATENGIINADAPPLDHQPQSAEYVEHLISRASGVDRSGELYTLCFLKLNCLFESPSGYLVVLLIEN